jgi:hypothetical protein
VVQFPETALFQLIAAIHFPPSKSGSAHSNGRQRWRQSKAAGYITIQTDSKQRKFDTKGVKIYSLRFINVFAEWLSVQPLVWSLPAI